jgi:cation diffusion facilitator CzcD-associated flavoprotein CzcO
MASSEPFNVKRVAIIGAGPAGIAAAKYAANNLDFFHYCTR